MKSWFRTISQAVLLLVLMSGPVMAAFPTTSILDNFNRTNEGPPPSSNWTGGGKVVSNQLKADAAFDFMAWDTATFGPDVENYWTIVTKPATGNSIQIAVRSDDFVGTNCYYLLVTTEAGTDTIELRKVSSGSTSSLATAFTQEISSSDVVGISAVGSSICAQYNGSPLGCATDSSFSSAGYIGIGIDDTTTVLDNVGGGTYVPPPSTGDMFRIF